jgi:HAD superfamily hydrolase (TIGR01549 family)
MRSSSFLTTAKGIVFDVDGTLYYQNFLRATVLLLLSIHLLFKPKDLLRSLKVIKNYRKALEELRYHPHLANSLQELQLIWTARTSREPLSYVKDVVSEWIHERPLYLLKLFKRRGLNDFLRTAQTHGIKLGIYSDYPCHKKLHYMGILHYFDCVLCSFDDEVQHLKPHPKGFLLAAEKLQLPPQKVLYIGDRTEIDGFGAISCEMKFLLLKRFSKRSKTSKFFLHSTSFRDLQNKVSAF